MTLKQYFILVDTIARLSLKAEARRYYFGFWWWVIEPLLYVAVFYIVFEKFLGTRTQDFLMFLIVGKFTFIWFSKTVNYAGNSLMGNASLIGRMDLPKTLFPMAVVLECSYRQIAVFALLGVALIIDGYYPNAYWLWVLPLICVEALLIVLCGFIASVLVCVKRDFALLINLGMLFLLFMSGVFWDLNDIGNEATREAVLLWNPVAFLLHSFRQALLWQQTPDLGHLLGLTVFLSGGLLLVARGMARYRYYLAQRVVTA
ncbi:ABC transporter permease [Luminiphilus sp. nBUS_07]|uniref:ABC transporter permease n=1 Tax=Luminiphilus sp. nBUS_07 TaxID=3395314 RepID=UPI003EBBD309